MKFRFLLPAFLVLFSLVAGAQKAALTVTDLRTEHFVNPLGLDAKIPRFSWKLAGSGKGIVQKSYEIRVATDPSFSSQTNVWSSKENSDQSVFVAYKGKPLESAKRYYWQVRVEDQGGRKSAWSSPAYWETAFLQPGDWKAKWIEPEKQADSAKTNPIVMVRKEFALKGKPKSARAFVTAHGLYSMELNGKKITDAVLTPGWTSYNKRLQYQVYDITNLLTAGNNAIGAMLGEGWYRGTIAWGNNRNLYGRKLGLLAQLQIEYSDGQKELIVTDESWKASADAPILVSEIYNGETYDARKEKTGWSKVGFNESGWWPASVSNEGFDNLISQEGPMIRRMEEVATKKVFLTPDGTLVADLGQNITGWVKLKVSGPAGTTIKLKHAEVLDKKGNFYTENLRAAKQEIVYTLKGGAEEVYEPTFTFQGFRYVAIEGYPGELTPDKLTGVVVYSDMKPTGSFESSNALLNQLQKNIQWGQKGNFLDVPTDCPQRDERLGWTGDAQVFIATASYNMDVETFFRKWLKDVAADQLRDGGVPFVIPDVLRNNGVSAGWGDVALVAPYTIYLTYGDQRILEEQYESMKKYVDYMRLKSGESLMWKGGSVFGDWLFYHPHMYSHTEPDGYTNHDLLSTAFFAYSTSLLAKTAKILGKTEDAAFYDQLFTKLKTLFNNEFVSPSGRIVSDSQTGYVLGLMFGLIPEDKRTVAASHLVRDIRNRGNHLSTGFLGTPYLCHVLSSTGYDSVAYDLLLQESYPGWLYPVKMGATTIWERWDGLRPDSTFQDAGMNSFNHYAYGAIGDWMYKTVTGIRPDPNHPGYKHFYLAPVTDKRLQFAKAAFNSAYGEIKSGWTRTGNGVRLEVTIPANSTATLILPTEDKSKIVLDGKPAAVNELKTAEAKKGSSGFVLGSGVYVFEYPE